MILTITQKIYNASDFKYKHTSYTFNKLLKSGLMVLPTRAKDQPNKNPNTRHEKPLLSC